MKHIMISIKPKWVAKILNGEKTIEIRKSMPKDLPCKVYIYCTKDKNHELVFHETIQQYEIYPINNTNILNGKVVAEFTLNKITTHKKNYIDIEGDLYYNFLAKDVIDAGFYSRQDNDNKKLGALCNFHNFVEEYGKGKDLYAWHIDDLEIYDKPKELNEFGLKRPPQSWCYIEGE